MLLSDPRVVRFLNDEVVPCWESVRPVPKVTIDFGDGRKLDRTLAGNTVMYLCLPDGRVVDTLPGVYTPEDFLGEAHKSLDFARTLRGIDGRLVAASTRAWHLERLEAGTPVQGRTLAMASKEGVEKPILRALDHKLETNETKRNVEGPVLGALERRDSGAVSATARPRALVRRAAVNVGKMLVESPVLDILEKVPAPPAAPAPRGPMGDAGSDGPRRLSDLKSAFAAAAARIVDVSKQPATAEELRAAYGNLPREGFERRVVELDSRTNVERIRPVVHLFFAGLDRDLPTPRDCRDAMFKQVLHVAVDDPYLGLAAFVVPGTSTGRRAR